MELVVYPYVMDAFKSMDYGAERVEWNEYDVKNKRIIELNEQYFEIKGFNLKDDGTLAFVMSYEGGKPIKNAAVIKLSPSEVELLRNELLKK